MFSMPDIAVIMAVALIIFGPGKIPQIGQSLGKSIRNFKKATEEEESVAKVETTEQKALPTEQQAK